MTLQKRKHIRKKQKTRTMLLVILTLIIGFSVGVFFTIALSRNYTIVISQPSKTEMPITTDSKPIDIMIDETEAKEHLSKNITDNKKIIAIDAGHQQKGNFSKEPIGPGASQTKAKVAGGATGILTKIPEYQVTLDVSLLLEEELKARGYDVVMIRRTNDVDISNSQRAMIANDADVDVFIRIHCNGVENSSVKGALTMCQTSQNQYCGDLHAASRALSEQIIDCLCIL